MIACKLICGDVIDAMKTLEDDSIDLIVTSPPYGVGKEYEKDVSQDEYAMMLADGFRLGTTYYHNYRREQRELAVCLAEVDAEEAVVK